MKENKKRRNALRKKKDDFYANISTQGTFRKKY